MTTQGLEVSRAKARADRIRHSAATIFEDLAAAWRDQDWRQLGYRDWDDYLEGEFSAWRNGWQLAREQRGTTVRMLREAGMSLRAIEAAAGVPRSTVQRETSGVPSGTPEAQPVTGRDGKTYPASRSVAVVTDEDGISREVPIIAAGDQRESKPEPEHQRVVVTPVPPVKDDGIRPAGQREDVPVSARWLPEAITRQAGELRRLVEQWESGPHTAHRNAVTALRDLAAVIEEKCPREDL